MNAISAPSGETLNLNHAISPARTVTLKYILQTDTFREVFIKIQLKD